MKQAACGRDRKGEKGNLKGARSITVNPLVLQLTGGTPAVAKGVEGNTTMEGGFQTAGDSKKRRGGEVMKRKTAEPREHNMQDKAQHVVKKDLREAPKGKRRRLIRKKVVAG